MIKKIEITNVGRFKSAKTDGDAQFFKKNTFIYGKNTHGKSTLTAIFRALKENRTDYIIGRKTIGTQKQTVKIIPEVTTPTGEYRYTTDEAKWSAEYKDIIVFDNHFVRESVYTQNQQIGQEQQKNIEAFMLGAKGAEYNANITKLTEQIAENTRTQTSVSSEYNRNKNLLGGLSFDDFLGLTEVADIDRKIEEEKNSLDKIKNSELISSKLGSIKSLLERYRDFDSTNISEKLSVNSELVTKHYDSHVNQKESKQSYSSFLQTGSKLRARTEKEYCPFCTQEITEPSVKEFLKTIDLIYNDKYRTLQQAIKDAEALFPQDSFTAEISRIKTDLKQAGYDLAIDFTDVDGPYGSCEKAVADKKDDLATDFDTTPFTDISSKAVAHIATIDKELLNFTNPTEKKAELETSLKLLEANKERFSSWKDRCESYQKAKKENVTLSAEKTKLWEEYLVYANGLSASMLQDINDVLSACNCDFTVTKFNFKGNQRQDLLVLSMSGSEISNDGDDGEMTIKNALSDSDKWVLALAFFLATVKNDSAIKVVVMDDPVSSFDSDRKRIILTEIKRILKDTGKQLVLLTHEKGFYQLLHAENSSDATATFLRLSMDTTSGTDFIACSPHDDAEFMSDYNCWIADMKNANSSQDLAFVKNAHASIRKVIEHILKTKYPLEITKEINTVGDMLTKLEQPGGSYVMTSRRTNIEAILTNQAHHDHSGTSQYPTAQLGIEDYKKDIRDAFELMKIL
ncbi:MAG: AAA family ATPase [Candidatus Nomurabacteria bacterium]|nr:AAA family ATPase [Candidatus Nomurabacteria bacterium]USN87278.1 MAG: AAA family ATPase [Candidatus Nomurabacteria bacterium]